MATVALTFERTCLGTDNSSHGSMHINQLLEDCSSILCYSILWLSYIYILSRLATTRNIVSRGKTLSGIAQAPEKGSGS